MHSLMQFVDFELGFKASWGLKLPIFQFSPSGHCFRNYSQNFLIIGTIYLFTLAEYGSQPNPAKRFQTFSAGLMRNWELS